jgi:hypothetical protein
VGPNRGDIDETLVRHPVGVWRRQLPRAATGSARPSWGDGVGHPEGANRRHTGRRRAFDALPVSARRQLADGVEEAYGAVYMQSDANLITVRAMRLAPGEKPWASAHSGDPSASRNPRMARVAIGPIVAIVTGDGECFQAVGAYLKSLAN